MPGTPDNHYEGGYPIKLVRDRDGERLGGDGTITYEPLCHEDHVLLLRQKLLEEVGEYLINPCVGELADVLTVVRALAHVDLDESFTTIEQVAVVKQAERGGFEHGLVMVGHHLADQTRLGPVCVECGMKTPQHKLDCSHGRAQMSVPAGRGPDGTWIAVPLQAVTSDEPLPPAA